MGISNSYDIFIVKEVVISYLNKTTHGWRCMARSSLNSIIVK
jgi:hypothetical protein